MDRRSWLSLLVIGLVPTLFGCGDSSDQASPKAAASAAAAVATTTHNINAATPKQAVHCFLEAVRKGDEAAAGQMLTDLARKKTQEIDMVVAPPGSETARFTVGQAEMVEKGVAYVACDWTDLDSEGKPRTDKIVWTVKLADQQWRIAGMAAKVFPDRPAIQLDFENPQEMLRQQQLIEQEATAQMQQRQQRQASRPQDPFQTGPK